MLLETVKNSTDRKQTKHIRILVIMQKLREAKSRFKVPKLKLPSLPNLSLLSKSPSQNSIKTPTQEQVKKQNQEDLRPEYIHIPLKPPEGQTDEFSYLEFGEKRPEENSTSLSSPFEASMSPISLIPSIVTFDAPSIEISEAFDNERRSSNISDIVAFEIVKTETIDLPPCATGLHRSASLLIIEDDAKSETRSMILIMPDEPDEPQIKRTPSKKGAARQDSRKGRAKSAEPRSIPKREELKPAAEVKKKDPGPQFLHIPLKPPPGHFDEYSYLEHEGKYKK